MDEGKSGGLSERLGAERQARMEKETVSPLPRDQREHGIIRRSRSKFRSNNSSEESTTMDTKAAKSRQSASLATPNDVGSDATTDITAALNLLLADTFALYLKTKNFHWHMSGSHFRDYHLLLDEQADQIFATTDPIAERVRKLGGRTLHSIGNIKRLQRVLDNDADYVTPGDMLAELRDDNRQLGKAMREIHGVCDEHGDCRYGEPARGLGRRGGKAHLVSVRGRSGWLGSKERSP